MQDSDLITYSADRISVSDAADGQRVIVYTRLWDDVNKRYDMYASGGMILWLGDGTGTLEWIFTEYRDAVTKEPNYYYELYNPYSEKYIAPQLTGDRLLSDGTVGINMPGKVRKAAERRSQGRRQKRKPQNRLLFRHGDVCLVRPDRQRTGCVGT